MVSISHKFAVNYSISHKDFEGNFGQYYLPAIFMEVIHLEEHNISDQEKPETTLSFTFE